MKANCGDDLKNTRAWDRPDYDDDDNDDDETKASRNEFKRTRARDRSKDDEKTNRLKTITAAVSRNDIARREKITTCEDHLTRRVLGKAW